MQVTSLAQETEMIQYGIMLDWNPWKPRCTMT
jgi:hypothetical protein